MAKVKVKVEVEQEDLLFDWRTYYNMYKETIIRDLETCEKSREIALNHWKKYGKNKKFKSYKICKIDKNSIPSLINNINDKYVKLLQIENSCYPERVLVENEYLNVKSLTNSIYVTRFVILPSEKEYSQEDDSNVREFQNKIKTFLNNSVKDAENLLLISKFLKKQYEDKMNLFIKKYNICDENIIINEPKVEFRYFCFKHLDFMRNCFIAPKIELFSNYEAVFIEFRKFDHIEFILRNAILQLGSKWSFTVVCGNENYNFMITMCYNICKNIKIIKTTFNSVTIEKYSDFLKTTEFWNLLVGKKILIYQEDSFIFNNNIDEFIEYDYIGAPWTDRILPICVGNGGLSLRTKQVMIDIIEEISKDKTLTNEIISEDVFFSKHMQRLNIGKIAEEEIATRFSSELIYNKNSFAGHQFWLSDPKWKNRMYNSMHKLLLYKTSS